MSVNNQGRAARSTVRRNVGTSLVRSFLIMLVLAALSFGFGFGVLANLIPKYKKSEEGGGRPVSVAAVQKSVAKPDVTPVVTAPASPAVTAPAGSPVQPTVTAPGPTLDPAPDERDTSGDVQRPRRVEGDTTSARPDSAATGSESASVRTHKKKRLPPKTEEDSQSGIDSTPSPEATQNAADNARSARSTRSTRPSESMNPADDTVREPKADPAQKIGLYRVQIGVFSTRESADSEARRAADKGITTSVRPFDKDGVTLYRVQHGAFKDRAHADAAKESLSAAGFDSSVSNPPAR